MYWNILVWLRIEIPDGFLHQISENLKIDDLVTGGTINLQLTHIFKISIAARLELPQGRDDAVLHVVLISRGGV